MATGLDAYRERITLFCQKWGVSELSVFGSFLRGDLRPDSDVDVLISFRKDVRRDLFDLVDMREELKELFGRDVDLVEKEGLRNPIRRAAILAQRQVIYAS